MYNIHLVNMGFLDISYDNVIDFESREQRKAWFDKRPKLLSIQLNYMQDGMIDSITVPKKLSSLRNYDYLYFTYENKEYFYFIIAKDRETQDTTTLYLELDVFTTHQFDISYMDSFIDRCHVHRWNQHVPTINILDEGLEPGDIEMTHNPEVIYEFKDSVILASSVPMGFLSTTHDGSEGGDTPPPPSSGNGTSKGKLTNDGFRFIKGYEGFAPTGAYLSGESFRTVGYGSTEKYNKTYYDKHKPFPCTEQKASEIYDERIRNEFASKVWKAIGDYNLQGKIGCHQFDAMISLAYNRGYGGFLGDSTSPWQVIKSDYKNYTRIREVWEKYAITASGKPLQGLVKRRKAESDVYCLGKYEMRDIIKYNNEGTGYDGVVTENKGNGFMPNTLDKYCDGDGVDLNGYKYFDNAFGKNWLCPVKNATVTSKYGWRTHPTSGETKFHHGTDLGLAGGQPYVACDDGEVLFAGYNNQGFGNLVTIKHREDYKVQYPHLSKISVSKGDIVKKGQKIGEVGTTGNSTGNHAHWEIRRLSDNQSTDPAPTLKVGEKV